MMTGSPLSTVPRWIWGRWKEPDRAGYDGQPSGGRARGGRSAHYPPTYLTPRDAFRSYQLHWLGVPGFLLAWPDGWVGKVRDWGAFFCIELGWWLYFGLGTPLLYNVISSAFVLKRRCAFSFRRDPPRRCLGTGETAGLGGFVMAALYKEGGILFRD